MPVHKKQPLSWFKASSQVRHSLTAIQEITDSLKGHGQLQDMAALAEGTLIYGHRRGLCRRKGARIMLGNPLVRKIVRVKRKDLKLDDVRKNHNQDDLRRLGKSVKKKQWIPLVIKSDGTIVDGNRRVMGGDLEGVEEYDCIVIDEEMTHTQVRLAQAITAIHRKRLSGWEKYIIANELLQTNLDWTDKRLAAELDMSDSMMVRVMAVNKVGKAIRDQLEAGQIGLSALYSISKEKDEAKQLALLELKLKGGASRDEIERVRRNGSGKKWNRSISKTTKVPIPLVSGVTVTFSGVNLTLEALTQAAADVLDAAKTELKKEGSDTSTLETTMRNKFNKSRADKNSSNPKDDAKVA